MEEELIGIAFIKIRINDLRLSQLRANSIKAEIGKIAQCPEFSNFSKEELLEFFKKPAIEKLEELITEIKAVTFK